MIRRKAITWRIILQTKSISQELIMLDAVELLTKELVAMIDQFPFHCGRQYWKGLTKSPMTFIVKTTTMKILKRKEEATGMYYLLCTMRGTGTTWSK